MTNHQHILANAYRCPSAITPAIEALMGQDMALRFGKYHAPVKHAPRAMNPANAEAIRKAKREKTAARRQSILAALSQPLTCDDVSRKVGISPEHARKVLSEMLDDGLVSVETVSRVRIWSLPNAAYRKGNA